MVISLLVNWVEVLPYDSNLSGTEMFKVLRHATGVVYRDIFMIQICSFSILPDNFSMSYEDFQITLHNLYLEQTKNS